MPIRFFILFLSSVLLNNAKSNCQKLFKHYVDSAVQKITSIDPVDTTFSDLAGIGEAIGDKRIVMLGELEHGDGSTFEAKTRIIKYLHEKLGFNVLAFESDFFAINRGWEAVKKGEIPFEYLIQSSIYPIWSLCKECEPLFDYIKSTLNSGSEIRLAGFDNQLKFGFSNLFLQKELRRYLDSSRIPFSKTPTYKRFLSEIDSVSWKHKVPDRLLVMLTDNFTNVFNQLDSISLSNDFYFQVLKSLQSYCEELNYLSKKQDRFLAATGAKIRDEQMSKNFTWLSSIKYPNDKIIVWAHNDHIAKMYDFEIFTQNKEKSYSMGYHFTDDVMRSKETYIIGFTEYSGISKRVTMNEKTKVSKPPNNSLEQWIHNKRYDYAFIDFSNFSDRFPDCTEKFFMKTWPTFQRKFNWYSVYDGVFYIARMEPCTKGENLYYKFKNITQESIK